MQWSSALRVNGRLCRVHVLVHNYYSGMWIELKFQFSFEFSVRRKQIIKYSHISYYIFYYHKFPRNVVRFTSANLPNSSVTISELCKPTYQILRLGAVVIDIACDNGCFVLHC
jgi:hypothetical protein